MDYTVYSVPYGPHTGVPILFVNFWKWVFFSKIRKIRKISELSASVVSMHFTWDHNAVYFIGNVNRDINLNFDAETEVFYSCGATLNGQFIIIGGWNEKRQVRNSQIIILKDY